MHSSVPTRTTATITAIGARSTVPDNPGAVDATIYVKGRKAGECTLLPDHEGNGGQLDTWGCYRGHWADDALARSLDAGDLSEEDVVDAVRAAVRAAKGVAP